MSTLDRALEAFVTAAPSGWAEKNALWNRWATLIGEAPAVLPELYATYLTAVRGLIDDTPPAALGGRPGACRFVMVFSASNYLPGFQRKQDAWRLLQEHHTDHLGLLRAALKLPDHVVLDTPARGETGRWGGVVAAMLTLYRRHKVFGPGSEVLEGDIIPLIPDFFRAFPQEGDHMLLSMQADHPDAARVAASWAGFHLKAGSDPSDAPTVSLASQLLGAHAQNSGAFYAQGPAIFSHLLKDAATWPAARVAAFWRGFVEQPLQIEPIAQDSAATNARRTAEILRNAIAATKEDSSFAAKARRQGDERLAREYEAEAALIMADFSAWNARRRQSAVRALSGAATQCKTLTVAAAHLPAPFGPMAQALLDEAKADAARPAVFVLARPAENRFRDFGMKLLVIEELMYRQGVLTPRFDIRAFAAEYRKREIDVESDGYAIIPEAKAYFANLSIPDDLLARVEHLHQSSGIDGGPRYIEHLFPFWDPGAGDGPVPVTAKAVADLDLLPNLRRISGLDNSKPNRTLLSALKARGITLSAEDQGNG